MNKFKTDAGTWNIYIHTYIIDEHLVWAGPNAGPLPLKTPMHIITAYNPSGKKLSEQENQQRNGLLWQRLQKLNVQTKPVIGCSPDKAWQEPGFAMCGLTRKQACEVADVFNQRGIFELNRQELLVIDVKSGAVKKSRPRVMQTAKKTI